MTWRAFVLLALLPLAACSPRAPRADLVILNGIEPETLDPAIISGQPEGRIVRALFEGLTSIDMEGGIGPGIAERWDVSPDGLTYTFHLRTNALWSNGDPLTADDFAGSWRRALLPSTASDYAEILYGITNAEAFNRGTVTNWAEVGVRVGGPRTLVVTLHTPTAYFLQLCAFPTYYPVHLRSIDEHPRDWFKPGRLVSNGAYRLVSWRINDSLRVERNPHYWRAGTVRLHTVQFLPVSRATAAFNLYHTGAADLTLDKGSLPPMLITQLRKRPDFHAAPILATYFYRFNVTRKPFDDVRVRRAIALAIDKRFLVDRVTRGGEPVAGSFTPPGIPGYTPPAGLAHDPDAARRLLAEAGFPGGTNFPVLSLLYNATEGDNNMAVALQDMLRRELGISIELRKQEWKVYLNTLSRVDFDIARSSWVGDYADPNTFLDCFVTGRGNNRTRWSNAQYDDLLQRANRELDPARRLSLMREAETILVADECPIVPVYHFVGQKLYDTNRIGGLVLNPLDEYPIRELFRADRASSRN
jgi:oligopeptide transport system substrate-binding protein